MLSGADMKSDKFILNIGDKIEGKLKKISDQLKDKKIPNGYI